MQVVVTNARKLRYVRADHGKAGPVVIALGEVPHDGGASGLARAFRATGLSRRRDTATLLESGEYQILSVEAPSVPPDEVKAALRWKLKEIIDFPVEEATYDILPMPQAGSGRAPSLYAVTARNEVIRRCMERFGDAHMPLSVIDIPETAQRNISALFEQEGRGVGVLFIDHAGGLLTLTAAGELILSRRIDVTRAQIARTLGDGDGREALFDRILVNLQRTIDGFERQFSQIVIDRILCGPEPEDSGLLPFLAANLGMKVEQMDLRTVMEAADGLSLDVPTQARFFHLIGCGIRDGAQA